MLEVRRGNSAPDERRSCVALRAAKEGQDVAFYTPRERHIRPARSISHREYRPPHLFQGRGAAAVASGLSHNAPTPTLATPRRGLRAQPEANTLVYGSPQDISNLDPHTGHDYSIAWGQRAVYDALLRYEGNPVS